jgi:GTP cyclohydrolase I
MDLSLTTLLFAKLMSEGLGLDLSDPDLSDTPQRVAKMFCNEFFANLNTEFSDWKTSPNDEKYDQIILFGPIDFVSVCSHHFLPFKGDAWALYVPDTILVGASKPARAIDHYSKRPQLQERLCHQVINSFWEGVNPLGAMIVMKASHGCMQCRGVGKNRSGMVTSAVKGIFTQYEVKQEGLELIKLSL